MRRLLAVVAAAVLLGVGASASHAATIPQNLNRVGVPAEQRAEYMATVASARALAKRAGGSKATALNAVLRSTTQIANQPSFSPRLAEIVFRELRTNVDYLSTRAVPSSGTRIRIDGIVYESYSGQGLRIQPLGTYFAVLEPGAGVAADGGVSAALDKALAITVPNGEALNLPYLFPYMGKAPTWESAMAEGVAASASLNAWNRSGNDDYLDTAIRFGNGALDDAVTLPDNGLWFPLYAFKPGYRVLNGHLQTVLAMGELTEATGDDAFASAYDRSVATTKAVLPQFDTGGWGRYAPGQDAPVKYMTLMASQLRDLGTMTGDPAFTDMGNRFSADLKTPPVITGPAKALKPVSLRKVKRGARPVAKVRIARNKPVTLVLRVQTAKGRPTKVGPTSIALSSGAGTLKVTLPRKRGSYRIVGSARDWAGNRVDGVVLAKVRVR